MHPKVLIAFMLYQPVTGVHLQPLELHDQPHQGRQRRLVESCSSGSRASAPPETTGRRRHRPRPHLHPCRPCRRLLFDRSPTTTSPTMSPMHRGGGGGESASDVAGAPLTACTSSSATSGSITRHNAPPPAATITIVVVTVTTTAAATTRFPGGGRGNGSGGGGGSCGACRWWRGRGRRWRLWGRRGRQVHALPLTRLYEPQPPPPPNQYAATAGSIWICFAFSYPLLLSPRPPRRLPACC